MRCCSCTTSLDAIQRQINEHKSEISFHDVILDVMYPKSCIDDNNKVDGNFDGNQESLQDFLKRLNNNKPIENNSSNSKRTRRETHIDTHIDLIYEENDGKTFHTPLLKGVAENKSPYVIENDPENNNSTTALTTVINPTTQVQVDEQTKSEVEVEDTKIDLTGLESYKYYHIEVSL